MKCLVTARKLMRMGAAAVQECFMTRDVDAADSGTHSKVASLLFLRRCLMFSGVSGPCLLSPCDNCKQDLPAPSRCEVSPPQQDFSAQIKSNVMFVSGLLEWNSKLKAGVRPRDVWEGTGDTPGAIRVAPPPEPWQHVVAAAKLTIDQVAQQVTYRWSRLHRECHSACRGFHASQRCRQFG